MNSRLNGNRLNPRNRIGRYACLSRRHEGHEVTKNVCQCTHRCDVAAAAMRRRDQIEDSQTSEIEQTGYHSFVSLQPDHRSAGYAGRPATCDDSEDYSLDPVPQKFNIKVHDQTGLDTRQTQVGCRLGDVDLVDCFHGFQFKNQTSVDQQINSLVAKKLSLIANRN
jgi:hypothetical protein